MTAWLSVLGTWTVAACLLGPVIGQRLRDHAYTPVRSEEEWLADIPTDCLRDGDPELDGRFYNIVAREWVL